MEDNDDEDYEDCVDDEGSRLILYILRNCDVNLIRFAWCNESITLKLVSDFFIENAEIIQNNINYSNYYKFILTNFLNIYYKLLNTPYEYQYLNIYNDIYNKYKATIKIIIKLKPTYKDINTYIYLEYELLILDIME